MTATLAVVASLAHEVGRLVLHSLWIGTLVTTWAAIALRLVGRPFPTVRYVLSGFALTLVSAAPLLMLAVPGPTADDGWLVRLVGAAWLAGLVMVSARVANGWRRLVQLRRVTTTAGAAVQQVADTLCARLAVTRPVQVRLSTAMVVPGVVGWRHPIILVPAALLPQLGRRELEAMLAHEIAHVRRHDYAWNLLQVGLDTLSFHQPAAWWVSGQVRLERERVCDALAATICDPLEYARSLTRMETRLGPRPERGTTPAGTQLLERVRSVGGGDAPRIGAARTLALIGSSVMAVAGTIALLRALSGIAAQGDVPLLATIGLGLLVGLRHVMEPDHLVTIATLVTHEKTTASAIRLGASWGIGHATALIVVALVVILGRAHLPAGFATMLEAAVAVMIVGLGLRTVRNAWRQGSTGHTTTHPHGARLHRHASQGDHLHIGGWSLARQPLAVGMVHGLAGSGALTALAISTLPSWTAQMAFLLVFGVGSTVGMAVVSGVAGWPLARFVRTPRAASLLSAVTGVTAIVFGISWGLRLTGL